MRTDTATADDFVECTTRAKSKRHWSLKPTGRWPDLTPLCDSWSTGYDQAWIDAAMPPRWRKRTVIADLPPCKQCDKSRARRMEGRKP